MLAQSLQPTGTRQYAGKGRLSIIGEAPADKSLAIFNMAAFNNAGAAQSMGLLRRLAPASMELYALESAIYTLRPLPTSAAPQQVLTTTNNDGFAIGGKFPPMLAGLNVSTAGAAAVIALQYFNGTSFVTTTSLVESDDYSSTGENRQIMTQPLDWAPGGPSGSPFETSELFFMQALATTAPGGAVSVDDMWGGQFLTYFDTVSDGGFVQVSYDWGKPLLLDGGENMMAYYSTPNNQNNVSGFFGLSG